MKSKKSWLSSLFLCGAVLGAMAQNVPTHEKYVSYYGEGNSDKFIEYFSNWKPGTPMGDDENFFISRVKPKKRFENPATQVDPNMSTKRKFCLWTPMGISDTYWQSLPRYVMDGDNFSMWSYMDFQGAWSAPFIRMPAAYLDVTHKNGVGNCGGLIFMDATGGRNDTSGSAVISMLAEKDGTGNFKYAKKLAQYLRYYGIDGLGFNPEAAVPSPANFQDFLIKCREECEALGWHLHIYWYGTSTNNGYTDFSGTVNSSKINWLWKNNKQVVDVYMLNYNWTGYNDCGTSYVENLGGDPTTIYAGWDIQANWLGRGEWSKLNTYPNLSILFWGNHNTNMIYQNSIDYGSGDEAVQAAYLVKQEQLFSGGNRNPSNLPAINNNIKVASEASMKNFHGIAKFLPARSVLQELPFITRFGLGNGKVFREEGKVTFNQKWFNIGVQDYLPTWRWWITDSKDKQISDPISCTFTFDDSWFAGSSLKLSGKTQESKIRMFKTKFTIEANDKISLRYKVNNGDTKSHLKLIWSKVGSESTFESCDIPDVPVSGEWAEAKFIASNIKMDGQVACIGFLVENTTAGYEVLLGEFGIVPAKAEYFPNTPTIITDEDNILLKRTYNSIDFKFSWKSAEPDADDPSKPIYNEDVDTWYFEVYCQAQGGPQVLCGTTTSWAHYVVGAPVSDDPEVTEYRVGVRAVAPDGMKGQIRWTKYMTIGTTLVDGIQCDKKVIKKNEEFTLSFIDPNQPEPLAWELKNSATGNTADSQAGELSFTTSLSEEGYYDLTLYKEDGSELVYRGYVQVSPDATGAVPLINDVFADRTNVNVAVNPSVKLSYDGRKGDGTVSRGLRLEDPQMFVIPQEYLPNSQGTYSIGFWFKPEKFAYGRFGSNLLNKRDLSKKWADNNWGAFWVHIWPEWTYNGAVVLDAGIISYTMYNNEASTAFAGNRDFREIPNLQCCTDGRYDTAKETYALSEGQWTHVLISYDGTNQSIYFNGKKVATSRANKISYTDCPITIGGSNVYHSGINGIIDDVQVWHKALSDNEVKQAMAGYYNTTVPNDLVGYWTFESDTYDADSQEFKNKGARTYTNNAYCGKTINGGGEDTSSAYIEKGSADINVEGNPSLPGSLPIATTTTYTIANVSVTPAGDEATATFTTNGTYDVTCTLKNGWGEASKTKAQYIVVVGGTTGIDENVVENLTVYPNPFIDEVTLQFAEEGCYRIDLFDAEGRTVTSKEVSARAGDITTLTVNGGKGLYYAAVSKDGKRLQTLKLIAK